MKLPVQHLVVLISGFFLDLLVGGDQKYQLMIANRVSKEFYSPWESCSPCNTVRQMH